LEFAVDMQKLQSLFGTKNLQTKNLWTKLSNFEGNI
jgi:hypothetical protein